MDNADVMKQKDVEKGSVNERKLGKTEAIFQMMDDVQSNNFAIIVKLTKEISAHEVKSALKEEIEMNPVLGSTIVTRKRRYYFQLAPSFPAINLKKVRIEEDKLNELIAYHLSHQFAAEEAALYRFVLVTTSVNHYLVGIYSHSAGDAISAFHSMKRVLLSASGLDHDRAISFNKSKTLPPSLVEAAQRTLWPFSKIFATCTSNAKRSIRHSFVGAPKHIPQFHPTPDVGKHALHILTTEIGGDRYHEILTLCKTQQVTVNTFLVTLLFLSLHRQWQDAKARNLGLTLAVDMRRRFAIDDKVRQFGLYMGTVTFSSKISHKEDFWNLARTVAKDLSSAFVGNEHLFFELLPKGMMKKATKMAEKMGPPLPGPLLSNVGKVFTNEDEQKLFGIAEDFSFAVSPRKQMTFGLSVSSYNNKLNLLLTYNPASISEDVCQSIMARIDRGISEVAGDVRETFILKEKASVEKKEPVEA